MAHELGTRPDAEGAILRRLALLSRLQEERMPARIRLEAALGKELADRLVLGLTGHRQARRGTHPGRGNEPA